MGKGRVCLECETVVREGDSWLLKRVVGHA